MPWDAITLHDKFYKEIKRGLFYLIFLSCDCISLQKFAWFLLSQGLRGPFVVMYLESDLVSEPCDPESPRDLYFWKFQAAEHKSVIPDRAEEEFCCKNLCCTNSTQCSCLDNAQVFLIFLHFSLLPLYFLVTVCLFVRFFISHVWVLFCSLFFSVKLRLFQGSNCVWTTARFSAIVHQFCREMDPLLSFLIRSEYLHVNHTSSLHRKYNHTQLPGQFYLQCGALVQLFSQREPEGTMCRIPGLFHRQHMPEWVMSLPVMKVIRALHWITGPFHWQHLPKWFTCSLVTKKQWSSKIITFDKTVQRATKLQIAN